MVSSPPGKLRHRPKASAPGADGSRRSERCIKSRLGRAEEVVRQWNDDRAGVQMSSLPDKLERYLSSVDDLILVARSTSVDDDLHARGKAALDAAMARLADMLSNFSIWETTKLRELYGQIVMTRHLGSRNSSSSLSSTSNSRSASGGNGDLGAGTSLEQSMLQKVLDRLDNNSFNLIDPDALNTLCDIAGRMIQVGYAERMRETVESMSSSLLRDLKPLRICVFGGRSEVVTLKIWVSDMKFVVKVLQTMQRQLYEQNCGAFDEVKQQYFLKLAEEPITQLLKSAAECSAFKMPPQSLTYVFPAVLHALSAYEELTNVISKLSALVSEEHWELVSQKAEDILYKLEDAVIGSLAELKHLILECHLLATKDCDIHPITQRIMKGLALLVHHRILLNLVLARNHREATLVGSIEPLDRLVPELVFYLELMLEENRNGSSPEDLQYMFLINNAHFITQQVENSEMKPFFGDDWALKRQQQMKRYMSSYLLASWAPVRTCLAIRKRTPFNLWNNPSLSNFTSAFESTYNVQKAWKVRDPELRQKLRNAIVEMVVRPYEAYLAKYAKGGKSVRISTQELEEHLMELFEG